MDPRIRRAVYAKYREMLVSKNNQANEMIKKLPAYMVTQDHGFHNGNVTAKEWVRLYFNYTIVEAFENGIFIKSLFQGFFSNIFLTTPCAGRKESFNDVSIKEITQNCIWSLLINDSSINRVIKTHQRGIITGT